MQLATEEQKDKFIDILGSILSAKQVPTLEVWMAFVRGVFAIGVLVLSSQIIATPPPFVQGFALVLPAPAWAWGLAFTAALTTIGRVKNNLAVRRNGSAGGFFVMCGMLGPLGLKAPGLAWVMFSLLIPHVIVGLHLHRRCRAEEARVLADKAKAAGGVS